MDAFGFGLAFYLQDKASAGLKNLDDNIRQLIGSSESLEKAYDKGIDSMKTGAGLAAAGGAILMGLGSAVAVSMDFNKAVSAVGAVSNASAAEISSLKEQAMQLGEATAFTSIQVAEGQKYLAMGGFDVNDTLSAMPGLLSLASAGSIDLAKASEITANAMAVFGMKGSEAQKAADILAKGANTSSTSIESLGESIKYFSGTIATYKIPMEEAVAAIGLMGNAGLKGSVATSALSTAMARFAKPTKEMEEMMTNLGISAFDAQGKFVGLPNVIGQMTKASEKMTPKMEAQMLATIFGAEAMKNGVSLMNATYKDSNGTILKGAEAMSAYQKALENSTGAADKMAKMQLDNLSGDVEQLNSAMEGLAIRIGDKLEPSLRIVTQGVNKFVGEVTNFIKSPIGDIVIKFAGALGVMLVAAGSAYTAIAALKLGFTVFLPLLKAGAFAASTALLPLIGGIVAVAAALGTAWASLTEFDKVLHNMTVWETAGELKEYNTTLAKMGGFLRGVWEILQSVNGEGFTLTGETDGALNFLGEDVKNAVISAGFWIGKLRKFFVEGFGTAMKVLAPVKKSFEDLWTAAQPVFIEIGKALKSVFGDAFQTSREGMESWGTAGSMVFGALAIAIRALIYPMQKIAESITLGIAFWQKYKEEIKSVVGGVWAAIKTIWAMTSLPFRLAWDIGVGIVKGMQGGFEHGWGAFKTSLLQTVYDTIALLPGGEAILSTLGFERPKDYVVPKQQQQQVMQGADGFTGTMANSQYGLPNNTMSGLSNMQATNASTTGQLAAKQNEAPVQAVAGGGQGTPFVIQNTLMMPDGRVLAESVNQVNREQSNNSY